MKTILVIDDMCCSMLFLSQSLKRAGFKVLIAQSGKEGIKIAEKNLPNLILLDIMMPIMDGFEVCKHLKSQEKAKHIPIIFLTALCEESDKTKGFELGAVEYIIRPYLYEELIISINRHLS